jgi:elongation factor G
MAKYGTQDIRNIALIGHADSGKTSLADAILAATGVVNRPGSVNDKTSVCDFDPEEHARQHSVYSAVVRGPWKGKQINVIDTPGYPDFVGEVVTGLAAADAAVICVSAVNGIQVNTRRAWQIAGDYGLPRAICITKIDADNADYEKALAQVREAFGMSCAAVVGPDGSGGVTNLLAGDEPNEELVEAIAESDDTLMEKYLEEGELTPDEIASGFVQALAAGSVVPVLCCSATNEVGIEECLDAVANYFPAPSAKVPLAAHKPGEPDEPVELELDGPFTGYVFKVVTDEFVGKISYFRVVTGSIGSTQFVVQRTGSKARINQILQPQGKEQEHADEVVAGDIGCVAKIEDIKLGDTLLGEGASVEFAAMPLPVPMVSLAVFPKSRGDEQKLSTALQKLDDEDAGFRWDRDRQTKELVIRGMSSLHLDVILNRMKARYNVEVDTKVPDVAYLETITTTAQGHHRHKKQTGGRGQFGEVFMRVEPNERGEGLEYLDEIVGGAIPKQYHPAIEKGIREAMEKGVIAGYEVIDVKAAVHDGSFHTVDSDEASFKLAGARAFADAVQKAKPVLLEPIVKFDITVPSRFMGDITSDLSGRRGRISDTSVLGDMQVISGEVPLAEVQTYSTELRAMTGGEGSYAIEFSRYDVVPSNVAQQVIAKAKARQEEAK